MEEIISRRSINPGNDDGPYSFMIRWRGFRLYTWESEDIVRVRRPDLIAKFYEMRTMCNPKTCTSFKEKLAVTGRKLIPYETPPLQSYQTQVSSPSKDLTNPFTLSATVSGSPLHRGSSSRQSIDNRIDSVSLNYSAATCKEQCSTEKKNEKETPAVNPYSVVSAREISTNAAAVKPGEAVGKRKGNGQQLQEPEKKTRKKMMKQQTAGYHHLLYTVPATSALAADKNKCPKNGVLTTTSATSTTSTSTFGPATSSTSISTTFFTSSPSTTTTTNAATTSPSNISASPEMISSAGTLAPAAKYRSSSSSSSSSPVMMRYVVSSAKDKMSNSVATVATAGSSGKFNKEKSAPLHHQRKHIFPVYVKKEKNLELKKLNKGKVDKIKNSKNGSVGGGGGGGGGGEGGGGRTGEGSRVRGGPTSSPITASSFTTTTTTTTAMTTTAARSISATRVISAQDDNDDRKRKKKKKKKKKNTDEGVPLLVVSSSSSIPPPVGNKPESTRKPSSASSSSSSSIIRFPIGTSMCKMFPNHGVFYGKVDAVEIEAGTNRLLYCIRYDDGDREDLYEKELIPLVRKFQTDEDDDDEEDEDESREEEEEASVNDNGNNIERRPDDSSLKMMTSRRRRKKKGSSSPNSANKASLGSATGYDHRVKEEEKKVGGNMTIIIHKKTRRRRRRTTRRITRRRTFVVTRTTDDDDDENDFNFDFDKNQDEDDDDDDDDHDDENNKFSNSDSNRLCRQYDPCRRRRRRRRFKNACIVCGATVVLLLCQNDKSTSEDNNNNKRGHKTRDKKVGKVNSFGVEEEEGERVCTTCRKRQKSLDKIAKNISWKMHDTSRKISRKKINQTAAATMRNKEKTLAMTVCDDDDDVVNKTTSTVRKQQKGNKKQQQQEQQKGGENKSGSNSSKRSVIQEKLQKRGKCTSTNNKIRIKDNSIQEEEADEKEKEGEKAIKALLNSFTVKLKSVSAAYSQGIHFSQLRESSIVEVEKQLKNYHLFGHFEEKERGKGLQQQRRYKLERLLKLRNKAMDYTHKRLAVKIEEKKALVKHIRLLRDRLSNFNTKRIRNNTTDGSSNATSRKKAKRIRNQH